MKYNLEEKMFKYKKFMSLGSPTLVLKNDLGLKPYKKPDLHEIETNDYPTHI